MKTASAQTGEKRHTRGLVYAFYSYKGGVGRSMALANITALLAKWGKKVLVVDWDLEARGIERFFEQIDPQLDHRRQKTPGVVDLIEAVGKGQPLDWRKCVLKVPLPEGPPISLITAGQAGKHYFSKVQSLSWERLFDEYAPGNYLDQLRNEWTSDFEFVLIDSRTGINDIGNICTILLPDVLIMLFSTSHQSIDGVRDVMQRARAAQDTLPVDRGRLVAVPVLARDESQTEYELAQKWRDEIADELGDFYKHWLPKRTTPADVLKRLYLPYFAYWSFGERLPVVEDADSIDDPRSIVAAYARIARLLSSGLDWTKVGVTESMDTVSASVDTQTVLAKAVSQRRFREAVEVIIGLTILALLVALAIFGVNLVIRWVKPLITAQVTPFALGALGGASGFIVAAFLARLSSDNGPPRLAPPQFILLAWTSTVVSGVLSASIGPTQTPLATVLLGSVIGCVSQRLAFWLLANFKRRSRLGRGKSLR